MITIFILIYLMSFTVHLLIEYKENKRFIHNVGDLMDNIRFYMWFPLLNTLILIGVVVLVFIMKPLELLKLDILWEKFRNIKLNTNMAQLAIKGHETRGKEVIEILKMLGGKIFRECGYEDGFDHHYVYFIDTNENYLIDGVLLSDDNSTEFSIFTLEEFLEKFPYKIGDKVVIENYKQIFEILSVRWCAERNIIMYQTSNGWYNVDKLQPYKELL